MESNTLIFLGVGIVAVVLIMYFLRSKIKVFDINFGKGLLKFSGKTHANPEEINGNMDLAHKVLNWIQEKLFKVQGNYVLTETTNENARTAAQLYTKLSGDIISTCFFESPDYGSGDYANSIAPGTNFTRITLRSLCDKEIEENLRGRLAKFECRGKLIVIPEETDITKIGGMFCKLPDKSYLAFLALNNVGGSNVNHGLTFSCEIAERLYNYYNSFK